MNDSRSILILCGGTGPRLWPLSRASKPKQFLKIFNNESFLRQSVKRCLKVLPKDRIYLISNQKYLEEIKADLGNLVLEKNIIGEPQKKNTMMAIALGASVIGEGTIASIHSDYYIEDEKSFVADINKSFELAEKTDSIVTIGVRPSWNNPAFGYIEAKKTGKGYLNVKKFIEKPDAKKAEILIKNGALWNSGMYIFRTTVMEQELKKCNPEYAKLWEKLKENNKTLIKKVYELSPTLAVDKAVSEKSRNLITIEARFDWSDVGEWGSIYKKLTKKKGQNIVIGKEGALVEEKSFGCLVKPGKGRLIGLCGVSNLAVIETEDALLVCNLADSYEVRNLITKIVADRKLSSYFLENHEK